MEVTEVTEVDMEAMEEDMEATEVDMEVGDVKAAGVVKIVKSWKTTIGLKQRHHKLTNMKQFKSSWHLNTLVQSYFDKKIKIATCF